MKIKFKDGVLTLTPENNNDSEFVIKKAWWNYDD